MEDWSIIQMSTWFVNVSFINFLCHLSSYPTKNLKPKTLDIWTHGKIKLQISIHIQYSCQIPKQNCIDNFLIHTQSHKHLSKLCKLGGGKLFVSNKVNATHMSPYLWTFNEGVNGATTNFPPTLHYDYINKWTTFKLTTIFMYFKKIKQS